MTYWEEKVWCYYGHDLTCDLDAENRETVLKVRQNKCLKGLEYCIIITKTLVIFSKKTSFLDNRRGNIANMFFRKLIICA